MERIIIAVCPVGSTSLILRQQEVGIGGLSKCGPTIEVGSSTVSSVEQQLAILKDLKNLLVGNNKAKTAALRLGIVGEILSFLDAAARDHALESALLQALGLLAILSSSSSAEIPLAPYGARIVGYIKRALEYPSEKIVSISLRVLSSLCTCLIPTAKWPAVKGGQEVDASFSPLLSKVSVRILGEITCKVGKSSWTPSLRTLGVQALAVTTREKEIAKALFPMVVSSGIFLLRPILPGR